MRGMQWAGGGPHARLPSLSPKPISAFGGRPPSQWHCRRDLLPIQGWSSLFSGKPRTSSPREAGSAPSQLGCCHPRGGCSLQGHRRTKPRRCQLREPFDQAAKGGEGRACCPRECRPLRRLLLLQGWGAGSLWGAGWQDWQKEGASSEGLHKSERAGGHTQLRTSIHSRSPDSS